jgi:spermidine synthase
MSVFDSVFDDEIALLADGADLGEADIASMVPNVQEDRDTGTLTMRFGACGAWTQSCMLLDAPEVLALDYTRTLMGFLLFEPRPLSILMIGLGGGSLAKYCHRHLPQADITVVEINPHVIALRERFHVPPDSARFRVVRADGVAFIANAQRCYDVVIVDGFTHGERDESMCCEAFYRNCQNVLGPTGVVALNLLATGTQVCCDRLARVFDGATVAVRTTVSSNVIAFAGGAVRLAQDAWQRRRPWQAAQALQALPSVHQHTLAGCAAQLTGAVEATVDAEP